MLQDYNVISAHSSISATAPWWRDEGLRIHINGIFKGGGAKGIMYAGALSAFRDRGFWFRAAAGSSAGAITATLIAAGLKPEEMAAEIPEGLRSLRLMPAGDLIGSPLYRTKKLASWLDQILLRQVHRLRGPVTSQPITFQDLFDASGIELYVVAVDVATRQPLIFSAMTTPGLSVADSVLASSAIPIAFRPGRLVVSEAAGRSSVHRLMDGGVWANYPAFVFKDPSFRAYHELGQLPDDSLTVGFTLDTAPAEERAQAVSLRRDMRDSQRDKGGFLPWAFRFPPLRLYIMTIVPLIIATQTWITINEFGPVSLIMLRDYSRRRDGSDFVSGVIGFFSTALEHFFANTFTVYVVTGFIVVLALFLAVIGGTLLDSGVPAMRTLMSVGTDVPYWIGADKTDYVIRLRVPNWLQTKSFRLSDSQIAEAITMARAQAEEQVPTILSEA